MAYRHLFCAVLFSLISLAASAQQVVKANKIIARDSLHLSGKTVAEIFESSNFATATHKDLPTALAVKNYFEANAIDSISIVGSIVILYAAGAEITRDTLPPGITEAEVAQMISDSIETIPGTNLSFSGATSPVTLQSSTGTDVSFLAGTGMGFSQTGNQLTLNNTGVLGSGAAGQVPYFTSTNTVSGENYFTYNTTAKGLQLVSETLLDLRGITVSQNSNDIGAAASYFLKSRGTFLSKTAVLNQDLVGVFAFRGYSGTQYLVDNSLFGAVITGSVSASSVPTSIFFGTGATGGQYSPDLLIHSGGNIGIGSSGNGSILSTINTPPRTATVYGELRVTDLTTDSPTKFVGADADGDFAGISNNMYWHVANNMLSIGGELNPSSRLQIKGVGTTSATFSILAEDSDGTDRFWVRDDGGIFAPIRTGTATALAGWDSSNKSTDVALAPGLTLTSGTLDVNRDSFSTYNIFTRNGTFTGNRTGTIPEDGYLLFQSTNSESGQTYKNYLGTVNDGIYFGDYVYGRYSLMGDVTNWLLEFDGYSYDDGANQKVISVNDGSSNTVMLLKPDGFQVQSQTGMGENKLWLTDSGTIRIEGDAGIELYSTSVAPMLVVTDDAARLESSLVLVNDAADLSEDGQIWKEENRLNFNTANLSTALPGVMFTGTADKTVANTTTETTLIPSGDGTVNIPANYLRAGKTFTVEAWGIYTADASPSTLEIKASLGGVLLCTTGANTMTTSEGGQWRTTITFTCRTAGVSGTVMTQGETRINHAVGAGTTYWMRRSATNTINTTTSNAIDLTATHGAADADNSITLTNITVEILN